MKNILILALTMSFAAIGFAQDYTEQSDPQAKAILEKMKTKYESYQSLRANFSLIIELPEEDAETQQGSMSQMADKYRMEMGTQSIICDGETLWLHLKDNNEVQINDFDPEEAADGEIMSPNDLLRIYEKDGYIYQLAGESTEKGRTVQHIEFKPTDEDADFFKLRLTIDKKTLDILQIKAFSEDGSRFTLVIDELETNPTFDKAHFSFDKGKFPGVHVEDLRI